ncbi:MAG: ABC transporter transmembrane domain-containing protein, partial [Pseudomonadota bacterium]|nr:ABC transporter transmembrane domain-containing protein [Pseudomonadota bacterium]
MKTAIDSLADPDIEPTLMVPVLSILAIVATRFLIYVVSQRALRRLSISVSYDLRKRLFNHVQFQGAHFFNRFGTGDLMSRAVNDVSMV